MSFKQQEQLFYFIRVQKKNDGPQRPNEHAVHRDRIQQNDLLSNEIILAKDIVEDDVIGTGGDVDIGTVTLTNAEREGR